MPIRATDYAFRFRLDDIVERDRAVTLEAPIYSGASISAPASGTCTIFRPASTTFSTGVVVIGVDNIATYAITAASTAVEDLGSNWQVEWDLVMGDGRSYRQRNPMHLVLRQLYPVLTDQDLTDGRYGDLSRYLPTAETSWENYRVAAWYQIQRKLLRDQRRPWLVMEPSAFMDAHRELTLSLIFGDMGSKQRSSMGDRDWLGLARDHKHAYGLAWRELTFQYDEDETNDTSTERRAARPPLVFGATGIEWRF